MNVVYNEKGKARGRVCVTCTISSMVPGDTWETTISECSSIEYIRVCAARLANKTGRRFSITSTVEMKGAVVVRRTA